MLQKIPIHWRFKRAQERRSASLRTSGGTLPGTMRRSSEYQPAAGQSVLVRHSRQVSRLGLATASRPGEEANAGGVAPLQLAGNGLGDCGCGCTPARGVARGGAPGDPLPAAGLPFAIGSRRFRCSSGNFGSGAANGGRSGLNVVSIIVPPFLGRFPPLRAPSRRPPDRCWTLPLFRTPGRLHHASFLVSALISSCLPVSMAARSPCRTVAAVMFAGFRLGAAHCSSNNLLRAAAFHSAHEP